MIDLSLLGGWRLTADGIPVALPESGRRVVAYVAVRGPATRQHLVGALWPETPEHQANGSLRSTLWRIRRCLEQLIITRGDWVELGPEVRLDLRELRCTLARVPEPPLPDAAWLGESCLLPDWYDDWLLVDQEELRQSCLHAMERVAAHLRARGEYADALAMALAAVKVDPLRESAHRAVVEIHLREGNVSEALRHYEAYRRLLEGELGIEPSRLLRGMMAAPWGREEQREKPPAADGPARSGTHLAGGLSRSRGGAASR
ncbi:DNA-binding SARP family transcriptional activator [Streptacidiphilus sp. MAP12-20]|uniref:AfsR/SARP family transcriptional regulator n=1 Tax=Streptacidiphilus sp. MAP12-20 TaxID=3156299 RepID=UPI0035187D7D